MTLGRDARHIALPHIGADGQRHIAAGAALIVGAGGIGCATATYLVSSGVGRLVLADFDSIDATNLGRQFLYFPNDVGQPKVEVAARHLRQLNPQVDIQSIAERLHGDALRQAVADVDIVLDGCDNFATRFAVNRACVATGTRLISGAAIRMEGQVAVFGPSFAEHACYQCLYSEADESLENCAGNGVLSPVPGVVGTLMAVEALKSLAEIPVATARLQLYDAIASEFSTLTIKKRADCPVCGND